MLQVFFDFGYMLTYFLLELLLPLLVFMAFVLPLWYLQSLIILHAYYRIILPELRKNRILYWLIGWPAVASHELLGHALVSALTGSSPELHERISPERSAVRISHRRSAWGYFSAVIATIAPCFAPPFLLLAAFYFLFPGSLSLSAADLSSSLSLLFSNFLSILSVVFNSDLSSPSTFIFFYLLSALSLTAGASKTDFKIILEHTRTFWYFALFLLFTFSFGLELLRMGLGLPSTSLIFYPLASLLLLSFLLTLLGISLSLAFILFLRRMHEFTFLQKLLSFLAFPALYIPLTYTTLSFPPIPAYFSYLLLSLLFALLIQSALKLAIAHTRPLPRAEAAFKKLKK